ncbi:DNA binding domain-containing protein, excisionase family [Caldanaerobius fijiensis DSM 17918]|uniref:DNA binding domain-containing protein, excisionase family n=1 Tax=Caldanaerobius fijiensis DSM 17918 TaxID=1121256 RepID=A0A1M5EZQ6_9THEO|nr:helix-turn-helix domain-containing protein [Caldanaerobius fijiensis]SHF84765.1 DNA binding domain-containing protein, excisionase family [Caldanaerobius fijiensis DSM 17918]
MEKLYTLKEAEEITGIKARTWRYYVHTKRLQAVRGPRGKILIPASELEKFVQSLPKVR